VVLRYFILLILPFASSVFLFLKRVLIQAKLFQGNLDTKRK